MVIKYLNKIKEHDKTASDFLNIQLKYQVSPMIVGKHIVSYYKENVKRKLHRYRVLEEIRNFTVDGDLDKLIMKREVNVLGIITNLKIKKSYNGEKYLICELEDETGYCLLYFFSNVYVKYINHIFQYEKKVCLINGNVRIGSNKIYAESIVLANNFIKKSIDGFSEDERFFVIHKFNDIDNEFLNKIRTKYQCINIKDYISIIKNSNINNKTNTIRRQEYTMFLSVRKFSRVNENEIRITFEDETGNIIWSLKRNLCVRSSGETIEYPYFDFFEKNLIKCCDFVGYNCLLLLKPYYNKVKKTISTSDIIVDSFNKNANRLFKIIKVGGE